MPGWMEQWEDDGVVTGERALDPEDGVDATQGRRRRLHWIGVRCGTIYVEGSYTTGSRCNRIL